MRFEILGPLEVFTDAGERVSGASRLRALLAVLLLHANEPVDAERLAIALWGEEAGADAVKTVWVYVSRLRRALGGVDVLMTEPAGYRLRVRPGELDVERFETLVTEARGARESGRPARAAAPVAGGAVAVAGARVGRVHVLLVHRGASRPARGAAPGGANGATGC